VRLLDPFDPRIILAPRVEPLLIPLDNFGIYWAKVGEEDADWLGQWMWCAHFDQRGKLYAAREECRGGRRRRIYMHREIMARVGPSPDPKRTLVDHWDGDGVNNTRLNLRWVTPSENTRNVKGLDLLQARLWRDTA
jgi:hypothetical protein